jgi:hypothetical protein
MAKGKVLKPKRGYHLKKRGRKVMLMRGGLGVATISCGCSGTGTCGIVIDANTGTATCEGTCSGGCKWVVTTLAGIGGVFAA